MKWLWVVFFTAVLALVANPRPFGDSQRIMTWKVAARVAAKHPLLGVGPDGFEKSFETLKPKEFGHETAANAHNDFLQVAATLGLVGLLAYLALCLDVFTSLRGPAAGALVALFVSAKFSPIPLEALVLGAVICGAYCNREAMSVPLGPLGRTVAICFCIVSATFIIPLSRADRLAARWDLISISRAIDLVPWEPAYKEMMIQRGVAELNQTHQPAVVNMISFMLKKYAKAEVRL